MSLRYLWLASMTLFLVATSALGQQDCTQYNTSFAPVDYSNFGLQQHSDGGHTFDHTATNSCSYSGTPSPSGPVGCSVSATSTSESDAEDVGSLSLQYVLDTHYVNFQDAQGGASGANGASATADSEGAAAVQSCVLSCGTNISIAGSGQGTGFTLSFNPTPLWSDKYHSAITCAGETLPKLCSPTTGPPTQSTQNGYWTWSYGICQWVWVNCPSNNQNCSAGGSPIVIDTIGKGFAFTDPTKGDYVTFDLRGDGMYEKLSWPQHGSGNAWLVYDRDGDGIIKNGQELFGNFTPHSNADDPNLKPQDYNGFAALAYYDKRAQGGNVDAIIDKNDAIWPHLKLWIDNHCYRNPDTPCQSTPDEIYDLDSKGIRSLSIVYDASPSKRDAVGNLYKFYAVVNPDIHDAPLNANGEHAGPDGSPCCDLHKTSHDGRLMYDVFLRSVP